MMNPYMQETENALVHTYNRFPVIFEKGEGVYLYDTEGKKYLDFAAGIAVCGLGYGNPELTAAVKEQTELLWHTSNLFYNASCGTAAEALKKASGMDRVFFTNSGTEANEGMLKAARKYAWKKKTGRYEFIAMEGSFHGRSMGALSVTEHEAYRTPFEPLIPGVKFAKFNDLDSVKALISDNTCAIILEPIQGEGGINMADPEFLKGIRKLCDEEGILLLFDELQSLVDGGVALHAPVYKLFDLLDRHPGLFQALDDLKPVKILILKHPDSAACPLYKRQQTLFVVIAQSRRGEILFAASPIV